MGPRGYPATVAVRPGDRVEVVAVDPAHPLARFAGLRGVVVAANDEDPEDGIVPATPIRRDGAEVVVGLDAAHVAVLRGGGRIG